jgi:hypothetical protein
MSWRNTPPKVWDFETDEEYNEAMDCFYEAMEFDVEDRREFEL